MVFRFLLYLLKIMFKVSFGLASFKDKALKKHMKNGQFTMLVKTMDNKHTRYYRFADGKFSSKRKDYPKPDLFIAWSDSSQALSTIMKSSQKERMKSMSKAIAKGNLKMEIKGQNMPWFASAMFKMMKVYEKMIPFRSHWRFSQANMRYK